MEPIELSITEVARPTTKSEEQKAKEAKEAKPKAKPISLAKGMFRRMYGFMR